MTCAVAAVCMLRLWDQSVYWFSLMSSSKYTSAIIIKISYECGMWSVVVWTGHAVAPKQYQHKQI